jgi:TolB protein
LFESERNGARNVFVMNADGSGVRQLTFGDAWSEWAEWSPDGTRVAFLSDRSGNIDVSRVNADG